jgi:hypothetical protein
MFNLAEALWWTGRRKEAGGLYEEYLGLTADDGETHFRRVAAARVQIVSKSGD